MPFRGKVQTIESEEAVPGQGALGSHVLGLLSSLSQWNMKNANQLCN